MTSSQARLNLNFTTGCQAPLFYTCQCNISRGYTAIEPLMSAWLRGSKMNKISEYYNNSLRGNKRIASRQHPHAVRPEGWCCQMTPTFLPDNELIKGITSCPRLASTSTTCKSPQQCLHNETTLMVCARRWSVRLLSGGCVRAKELRLGSVRGRKCDFRDPNNWWC
ncbi:hypothetical protein CY34DRAFT_381574 [Suillus luteus UH-Slu-Lm8-n1]|uniref:Unplaced genomic scaffold CY34scaffold_25, whole genome shotgun sequence n=1 Tax=Suillus luteus UH-Slu-Lm8-n1 TaxID=930992 RepID=A0A0D0A946_9AGAM|nr:hypothetical protein CY34DRAFT_381574 [Suillus luteus UH-Slu-Lm8-n1]